MLDDALARERIVRDLETTFLIEAGAGSGKTTSLIGRMLALIETGSARAGEIAAITFTRKAADELKTRFRLELERRIRSASVEPGEPLARLQQALREADRCTVATIHSFCGQLLRERPVEAGLDPQFRELDDDEAEAFLHAAWDDYLLQRTTSGVQRAAATVITAAAAVAQQQAGDAAEPAAAVAEQQVGDAAEPAWAVSQQQEGDASEPAAAVAQQQERDAAELAAAVAEQQTGDTAEPASTPTPSLAELNSLGIHVEDLRQVYLRACEYRDVTVVTNPTPRPDFDLIRLSLPPMLEEAVAYIPSQKPDKGWDALQELVRDGRNLIRLHGLNDDLHVLELAKRFEKKLNVTQVRWTDKEKAREFRDRFQHWQITVLQPFLSSWREHIYPLALRFVLPAVEHAAQLRSERGLLDFQDLLMRAAALLREHAEVRAFFSERYTRLFVDEFQDTDPIQAELMFLLTGADPEQSDWRRAVPKPGSLFVVGDPKQSIYRFRRADISIYNGVKARMAVCGEVLQLVSNFRSVQAIGRFVNYEFNSRFPRTETEQQAAFVKMATTAPDPSDRKRALHGVHTITISKLPGGKEAIAEEDAERVATYIAWACKGNLLIQERGQGGLTLRKAEPGDFLILLKRREFIQLYAEKLELYGVPSVTSGSAARFEEIGVLALLAQSLSDPDDRIALLAVLKGMLFSASDNALYHYKMEGFPLTYRYLPERTEVSEIAMPTYVALERLAAYAAEVRGNTPALSVLLRIMEELGLLPLAAVRTSGSMRAGTIVKLLHQLQEDPLACGSWSELSARLAALASENGTECGELFAGRRSAVQVMNLHKAKGLEAPVVLLACPAGEFDHDASEHVDRVSGEEAKGYFTITRRVGYQDEMIAHPPGWTELAERERLFLNAEKERLLYVAVTRPKQLLIVSRYPDRPAIDPWSPLESSLVDARELHIPELEPAAPEQYNAWHDQVAEDRAAQQLLTRLARPTYRTASVTELAKSGQAQPPRPAEGRGMAFGSTVHRCIELLGQGQPLAGLEPRIRLIAEEEGMDAVLLPEVRLMLEQVLAHPLWQRAGAARRRVHELALRTVRNAHSLTDDVDAHAGTNAEARAAAALTNAEEQLSLADSVLEAPAAPRFSLTSHNPDTLHLKGVIDFLFEEEDGWVIVDFKTDIFEPGDEALFTAFYRPQVEAYGQELERSFGLKVKETGLYFLHTNKYAAL
ncbi:ATP-dependent helicase/nuclease subunit A [Paenibacillaceae bacterium GAS479]|nr:ATP-dependent helicase/nuclease subunit A [Paenibacillaceae bacterium GAS479]